LNAEAAVLLAAALAAGSAAADGAPPLSIDHAVFDFGSVVFGKAVTHTFVVRNAGDTAVALRQISALCDCFHARFDASVPPGGTGRIDVTIDTARLEGPVFLTARVHPSDAALPGGRLELRGFVNGPIMVLPRDHLDLTTVEGDDQEQQLQLEINRPLPLKVLKVDSTSAVFVPRWETLAPGRKYRIQVKVLGRQPPGVHRGTLRIQTDDPARRIIPVECSLLVVGTLVAEPETLFLPSLTEAEARKGLKKDGWKVAVRDVRGRRFDVLGVDSDLPFVHAWSQPRAGGNAHDLFVEIRPNETLRPGRTVGSLRVRTSLGDAKELRVPLWLDVR